ncbi:hypothetical protein F6Y05_34800 [Bacillus megaterium]|nr:hypothetical protein [Priestia megaterium]
MLLKIDEPRMNKSETELSVSYQYGNTVGYAKWYKKKGDWFLKFNNVSKELEIELKKEMNKDGEHRFNLLLGGFFDDILK